MTLDQRTRSAFEFTHGGDEVGECREAGLALDPAFAISRVHAASTAMSDDPTYLAQLEPIFEGMRNAGVPEG